MNNDTLPELLLVSPNENTQAQRLSRLKRSGHIRQLYRGVYSANLRSAEAEIVLRNWSTILAYLAPGAVISHRSAFSACPEQGKVFFSRNAGARKFQLPGLLAQGLVNTARGPVLTAQRPGARDVPYKELYMASPARAFLENLTADKRLSARQISRTDMETRLDQVLTLRGEFGLNALRDDAHEVAQMTDMMSEFKVLDGLIGALLGTHAAKKLTSKQALARAQGRPYDPERLSLFETLTASLRHFPFAIIPEPARHGTARGLFAFLESYFSNFIEGTTFTVEEAEQIVFHGKIIPLRSADSHDVKGTFDAALRDPFYSLPPKDAEQFLAWLKNANACVMAARPDKSPGHWKEHANQAGNTLFVAPQLVVGTLKAAWSLLASLNHPMQQALLAMFIVSEVHPFTDGNGRTARLVMNSFLSAGQQCRIIVPTVFREDYLLALKALTHQADATSYLRAMRLCQGWTGELDFTTSLAQLDAQLVRSHAKQENITEKRLLSPRTGLAMRVPE